MNTIRPRLLRAFENLVRLLRAKAGITRRALLRTAASEQAAHEAERLDRLRNPQNYRCR
jgi:hypothetical protein